MVDNTDLRIVEQLQKNGRVSLREIAKNLEISPSTSSNRFREMQANRVIKDLKPILDYDKLGLKLQSVSQIKVNGKNISEIRDNLLELEFIDRTLLVTGETDIMAFGSFKDRKSMNKLVRKIQDVDGVEECKTNIILESRSKDINLNRLKQDLED